LLIWRALFTAWEMVPAKDRKEKWLKGEEREARSMSVAHLTGKRSGRRRGSKSAPWRRAVLWSLRHLDEADAVAPTPLAGRLLALGRERPDLIVALAIQLEQTDSRSGGPMREAPPPVMSAPQQAPPASPPVQVSHAPQLRPIKKLTFPARELVGWLSGHYAQPGWLHRLPTEIEIVGCELNTSGVEPRLTIAFTRPDSPA
jgi:hypothetical protein